MKGINSYQVTTQKTSKFKSINWCMNKQEPKCIIFNEMMRIIHLQLFLKLSHLIQKELLIFLNIWPVVAVKSIQFVILSLICLKDPSTHTWMHGQVKILHVILSRVQILKIGTIFLVFTQICHSDHYWMNSTSCNKDGDMRSIKMDKKKLRVSFSTKWKVLIKVLKDNWWLP